MKWCNRIETEAALVFLIVLGICGLAKANGVVSGTIHTVQIPDFTAGGGPGQTVGGYPEVDEYDVVWTGWAGGTPPASGHPEIFYFDGATTTQLTSTGNMWGNWGPFISALNRVPYVGDAGTTNEVFFHDMGSGSTSQITACGVRYCMVVRDFHDHSQSPRVVSESMDQWLGGPFPPTWIDVDFWDGTQTIALQPRLFNYGPQVGQYNVVWHSSYALGGIHDVFLYNIPSKTTTQMTSRTGWTFRDPQLSENYIVWWGTDYSTGTQITLCDLNQGINYRHQVASSTLVKQPKLRNAHKYVVWAWADDIEPHDNVYYHDHSPPFPLTTQIFPTQPAHLKGVVDCIDACYPYAAFSVRDPDTSYYEIYLYDFVKPGTARLAAVGQSTSPVFVRVSTKQHPSYGYLPVVVWETDLGGLDNRAFMATQPACDPVPQADFDNDCTVSMSDLAFMLSHWGQSNGADITGNGKVDFGDLAILISEWLNCNVQPPVFGWKGITFP